MKAKIGSQPTEVHERPGSLELREPRTLWPGYEVKVIGERVGKTRVWAKIYYLYNGKMYLGWVAKEALVFADPALPDAPLSAGPVDIPVPDTKLFRNATEAIVSIGVVLVAIAFVAWAVM